MTPSEHSLPVTVQFNPIIRTYLLFYIAFFFLISIVGILLLPFWFLGVGQWWSRHYFQKLECELTDRALRFQKGILVHVEKTIPLENIQDVTFVAGPLLRYFDLCILKFETAGQSPGQGHSMELIGIIDAHQFRNQILEQRQKLLAMRNSGPSAADPAQSVLLDVRDILHEIRQLLRDHLSRPHA